MKDAGRIIWNREIQIVLIAGLFAIGCNLGWVALFGGEYGWSGLWWGLLIGWGITVPGTYFQARRCGASHE